MSSGKWAYGIPTPYHAPDWAKELRLQPKSRIQLAQLPTPIHRWNLPGVPDGFEVFIKRDDLTGATLTGNKVRKMEFVFADALAQGCDSIVTIGGVHSNHARTTAVAAKELGLEPHLLLLTKNHKEPHFVGLRGNMLLDRLAGANVVLCPFPRSDQRFAQMKQMLSKYSSELRKEGKNPYSLTAGGANGIGCWGYVEAFREMIDQGVLEDIDDIVVCAGTAGTAAGLGVANYLTGSKLKIHAFSIVAAKESLYSRMNEEIAELGLLNGSGASVEAKDLVTMYDGYIGAGYSLSTDEELELLAEVATKTGIFLDRVFTVKTVRGMLSEMKKEPSQFNGRRVLFIHTGGLLGLFDGELDDYVKESVPEAAKISSYVDIFPPDVQQ